MKKLWLLPCFTVVLAASDVSGKWAGNIEVEEPGGSTINTQVRAEFRQQADGISGKIGREEDQQAESIRNGKLMEGKRFTFEVSSTEASGIIHFVLTLNGDHLEGEMTGSVDGDPITGKVHLSRTTVRSGP
ncbi:MAG: hypothetical protein U0Q18_20855 [Bryobacteraceae bacterium]